MAIHIGTRNYCTAGGYRYKGHQLEITCTREKKAGGYRYKGKQLEISCTRGNCWGLQVQGKKAGD